MLIDDIDAGRIMYFGKFKKDGETFFFNLRVNQATKIAKDI